LIFNDLKTIELMEDQSLQVEYSTAPQPLFHGEWDTPEIEKKCSDLETIEKNPSKNKIKNKQLELF